MEKWITKRKIREQRRTIEKKRKSRWKYRRRRKRKKM